jgi:GGDEF domain-containing protein
VAGQYGRDGFLLLLPHTGAAGAARFCRRLRGLVEAPPPDSGLPAPLRTALGSATSSPDAASVQALLRLAEERLDDARAGFHG